MVEHSGPKGAQIEQMFRVEFAGVEDEPYDLGVSEWERPAPRGYRPAGRSPWCKSPRKSLALSTLPARRLPVLGHLGG